MFPVNYFLYLQIIIFLFITPGTPRIVIVSHSVNYGVKKCVWTALGDITGIFLMMDQNPQAKDVVTMGYV